jgi:hypothetical protein
MRQEDGVVSILLISLKKEIQRKEIYRSLRRGERNRRRKKIRRGK